MIKIDKFSLETHPGAYECWPKCSRLFFNGVETGTRLPGYLIEAQYQCATGYLIITSQDCPFEESNDFFLLTPEFLVLTHKELMVPFQSFLLHAHWPISDKAVRLHYQGNLFMTLSIRQSWGITGRKPTLVMEKFARPNEDPQAVASMTDLEQRLQQHRGHTAIAP